MKQPLTKKGFTLIELLVVIAIIAILAAILFPVFASAKARGYISACSGNLKQIGAALLTYAEDWNGVITPDGGGWEGWMKPLYPKYTRNAKVFDDPAIKEVKGTGNYRPTVPYTNISMDYYGITFVDDSKKWRYAGLKPRHRLSDDPRLVIVMCFNWAHPITSQENSYGYGGANILMLGGHVRFLTHEQFDRSFPDSWYLGIDYGGWNHRW